MAPSHMFNKSQSSFQTLFATTSSLAVISTRLSMQGSYKKPASLRTWRSSRTATRLSLEKRGVTLSGGQKARLALARALYADSDIFLLDDPISAVDSKVAREIHEKCIKRLSKSKTVILVTHQISFLYDCDHVIIMEDGKVKLTGHPS